MYVNSELVPEGKACILVQDYGLLYGYGLFETMRVYNGIVFQLEEHLRRLTESAAKLGITAAEIELRNAVELVVGTNNLEDAVVRLTLTYGVGSPRLEFRETEPSIIAVSSDVPDFRERYDGGIHVGFSEHRINQNSLLASMKTLNFMTHALAKLEAIEKRLDDVLLLNLDGCVCEATTSNLFLVTGGDELVTPSLESGALPGITRKIILELAKKQGLKTIEKKIKPDEVLATSEVFLTNSVSELTPVVEVDGGEIGNGKPGETTKRLHDAYKKLVEKEVKQE